MIPNESSHRLFLKNALALSAVDAIPTILSNKVSGSTLPATKLASVGERVNLACVGIGNQGGSDINLCVIQDFAIM